MTNGRVKLRVTTELGKVFVEVDKETLLTLTPEAAMVFADDLTKAAEPTLMMKAFA